MPINYSGFLTNFKPRIKPNFDMGGLPTLGTSPTAAPSYPTSSVAAPSTSPYGGRYTLDMDPEVIMALAYEHQGLGDLGSAGGGAQRPSTAQYDLELRHLQEMAPLERAELERSHTIGLEALNHENEIGKRSIINNLAGRGMLNSGERPYLQGEQARAYGIGHEAIEHGYTTGLADVDRKLRWGQEALAAARSAADSAYSQAQADYARGIAIDKRNLHERVITAYVNAYQRVIENPALYFGAGNFDPRQYLNQIPK